MFRRLTDKKQGLLATMYSQLHFSLHFSWNLWSPTPGCDSPCIGNHRLSIRWCFMFL